MSGAPTDRRHQGNRGAPAEARPIPHDLDLEADVLGAVLVTPTTDSLDRLAGVDDSIFYSTTNAIICRALRNLHEDRKPVTFGTVAELVARYTGKGIDDVSRDLRNLGAEHNYTPAAGIGEWLDTLERYRRRRLMLALTGELREAALDGVEWHTTAEKIVDLAHRNGAVAKLSTLELIDLGPILRGDAPEVVPLWLRRDDGQALLYPGRIHDLHAEPSVGKTWIALRAVAEVLADGGNAIYVDLEDTARNAVDRLRKLGVTDVELDADRFRYVNAPGGFQAPERNELFALVDDLNPDLVVLDGVAEALARDGLDENSNADVVLWAERLPRPIARRGAAVLMLDHVTKSPENRSRGARGAGAKLAIIDGVSYDVRLAVAYSTHREGLINLVVAKDRPGLVGAIGEKVAACRIVPHDGGRTVDVVPETPPPPGSTFRPTAIMAKIAERLANADHPVNERWLARSVRAKRPVFDEALAGLVIDGFVEEVKDPNTRSRAYRLLKPFNPNPTKRAEHLAPVIDLVPPPEEPPPDLFDEPPEDTDA